MNFIIYTGATGAGHTLAARSIADALQSDDEEVTVIDGFKEGGKLLDKTITVGYEKLVENWPKLYRKLYTSFDKDTKTTNTILKQATKILRGKFLADIESLNPDLVISTHPIITNMLGRMKENGDFDIPILAFVTDFVIHDMYIRDGIDAYVVSNDYTKQTMLDKNVSSEKIYTYGIPVRSQFRKPSPKCENDQLMILLMAGSLGSKQLRKAFISLLQADSNFKIQIVCGYNKQMKAELERLVEHTDTSGKEIEISGFVENIDELMDHSDLIITKPGGLTSTEAISKNVPIIIPYTYPGVEEYNRDYLVSSGLAIETEDIGKLNLLVDSLTADRSRIEEMKDKMRKASNRYSIDDTVKLCKELAQS